MSDAPQAAPETCAVCGHQLSPRALACPECGADERTGWREPSIYDGLDLPAETDVSVPPKKSAFFRGTAWIVALILVVVLALSALRLL